MKQVNSLLISLWVLFVVLFPCESIEAEDLLDHKAFDFPPGLASQCIEINCDPLQNWIDNMTDLLDKICNKSFTDCSDKAILVNHLLWIEKQIDDYGLGLKVTCLDALCNGFLDENNTYVEVAPRILTLEIGEAKKLQAVIMVGDGQCEGEIEWKSLDESFATVDKEGNVTGIAKGTATVVAVAEGLPHIIGIADVTVGQSSATEIVFVAQGDNNTHKWMGLIDYGCPTMMCADYPCYFMRSRTIKWGYYSRDARGETFSGRAAVDDASVIGISLSKEGPFVSGPIDIIWTVDDDGFLWSEEIFVKPLGEGSAYLYTCWAPLNGHLCDPLAWPPFDIYHSKIGPYEVSSSIVPAYDYVGMRDIGDQVVASLNQHFDDYRFRLITYSTHPAQSTCDCREMWPGFEPYLEPALFHEWVPLTNDPGEITQGLSSIRPFCDWPTNSEWRRFHTPYSNALRAIEDTLWREGSQRVVILYQDNSVDMGDYSVTVEPITGVTPEMVINAALSNHVSLYTMTNATMWVNVPLIEMAESTNGKFYYIGDYRPPWDSWVLNLFEAILDDISSQFSTYRSLSMEPPITSNPSFEGFETGNFNKFDWISYSDGGIETDWMITTDGANSGSFGARTGFIHYGQQSSLEVTVDCVEGDISFYRKISSESDYDYLKFYIDGLEMAAWSGNEDWSMESYPVGIGRRNFQWVYSKDDSVSDGYDTAWIDDIVFPTSDFMTPALTGYEPSRLHLSEWDRADLNEDLSVTFNTVLEYSESWLGEIP